MQASPTLTTISVAAVSKDMTTLATVKGELAITDSTSDTVLARLIQESSAQCVAYLGRELAQETIIDSFRLEQAKGLVGGLQLSRWPVASIVSLVEDGITLTASDYELDAARGLLVRLSADDEITCWENAKTLVTYVAGYVMITGLPQDLERACIDLVKLRWSARLRDPLVKSEQVDGVIRQDYWIGGVGGMAIPPDIAGLLDPYRRIIV